MGKHHYQNEKKTILFPNDINAAYFLKSFDIYNTSEFKRCTLNTMKKSLDFFLETPHLAYRISIHREFAAYMKVPG